MISESHNRSQRDYLTNTLVLSIENQYSSDNHNPLRRAIGKSNTIEALTDLKYIIS
jgi:hypothetical protein